jgi:ribosomal protein S6--L-glutamate ligase
VDIKVYNTGEDLYATVQPSPLHPDIAVPPRTVPLAADLARLVADVGTIFGLDLYGVDVVEGAEGWVVVDVNDFPSFRFVPDAVSRVASTILRLADHGRRRPPKLETAAKLGVAGDGSAMAGRLASVAVVTGPDDVTVAT